MAKQKMSTKKKASAVVAGALAVALAVGGAYAWTDYSQSALNTAKGTVAADVLLHDDFNGENKDVYVENTGENDVWVRVKFAEYLQIGNTVETVDYNADDPDKATDTGKADPDDVTTWQIHQFKNASATNNDCTLSTHDYFSWDMTGAKKAYLAGVTKADNNGYGGLTEEQFTKLGVDDPVTVGDIVTYKRETLPDEPVMMLDAWLTADPATRPTDGCWLLDTDGWAYWSKALKGNTATNLLLDAVKPVENSAPFDNWLYNIDVQLQAATINDMDAWYRDGIKEIANPDNSIATTSENGYKFVNEIAGDYIGENNGTVMGIDNNRYISVANNVYANAEDNGAGTGFVPGATLTLAGQDGIIGSADDNCLAGRRADNSGAGAVADIKVRDITINTADGNDYYKIDGVGDDIVVYAGIDKRLGTYDDVITSATGKLGKYDIIDGDGTNDDLVGWNYLGGPVENMLVATEYVLDNLKYNDDVNATDAYVYQTSDLATEIARIGTDMGIASGVVVNSNVDMSAAQHKGNNVYVCTDNNTSGHIHKVAANCTNNAYTTYYTETTAQTSFNADFFALSLAEVLDAYGDSTDAAVRKLRIVQAAPAHVRNTTNSGTGNWNNSTSWKDGDGNAITTTHYWLRSPGYSASRAAILNIDGYANARIVVTNDRVGARPACYMNLTSITS